MSQQNFPASNVFSMQSSGLASRRGGQSIKPLSVEALKSPVDTKENTIPTPRTSRGHLLAGLRTAPKSAAASTFAAAGSNTNPTNKARNRNSLYGIQESMLNNGPKTSMPQFGSSASQGYSSSSNNNNNNNNTMGYGQQHFTAEQILAPPEIHIDEQTAESQMDPDLYARLVQQNLQLAQQRQMLQQQLYDLTQAQQQLSSMNLNGQQQAYQSLYQQQQLQQLQQQALNIQSMSSQQPAIYTYVDPATGQQAYYIDTNAQLNNQFADQSQFSNNLYQHQQQQQQQQQQLQQLQQQINAAPRLQVSPPRETAQPVFRHSTPPRRNDSPLVDNPAPLPPPSANAFRRGHKKSSSLMLSGINNANLGASQEPPKSAGPKTATFPPTPLTGGYGPGQARAGEHPIRQPRGPPSIEELKAKPTANHEGSKNFAARTRRSALNNLMRAGIERRKVTGTGSNGSISPISETAEEAQSPLTDNESESGRSGSGSLNGEDVEPSVPSSRTSTGSWGAIGSDRPSSRQKARKSADSVSSGSGDETASDGSFASVFKRTGRTGRADSPGQRKTAMMVLSSAEKRKSGVMFA
ncbi:hypothetical protein VP1G_10099 [Cytospora mali]|uniref:Uncharacterized protein n=1 Tax=Cytospora mali TaxID=578113 RepID=A0A194VGI3_CYTMA|nr:hypothetical protein VP1G_10099 [Valsa mali var. pyri (nom. inval.)]